MPFFTDVNWPHGLLDIFNVSGNGTVPFESRYYGPYDRLFNYALIEGPFTFFLALQTAPNEDPPRDAVDFLVFMVVLNQDQKPVLIAEIKDNRYTNTADKRRRADARIRQLYDQMLFNCPIPRLYGLSLLGTSLRVYCGDTVTGEVTPKFVGCPDARRVLPANFLEGEWDLDILSLDGFTKMQEIVVYIKAETANVVV